MSSTGGGDDKVVVQFPSTPEERRERQRAKQAVERQRLVDLFIDEADDRALFHTAADECFADLIVAGVRQTLPVKSKRFRAEYVRYLQRPIADAPSAVIMAAAALKPRSVNEAIASFEMRALSSSIEREVHVRVARDGDHLFIDLGDPQWRAVRITAAGWAVCENPPVRFRRTPDTRPLPYPERGGSIDDLRQFLPNLTDDDFTLAVAFLLAALQPDGPYPVLVIYGEQGWAKTSLLRLLRALTDPHRAPTTSLPSSARDLFVAARNGHVQAFENVSKLSDAMSDNLCRLSTGGGMRTRALFRTALKRPSSGRARSCWKASAVLLAGPTSSTALSSSPWNRPPTIAGPSASCGRTSRNTKGVFSGRCATCWLPGCGDCRRRVS